MGFLIFMPFIAAIIGIIIIFFFFIGICLIIMGSTGLAPFPIYIAVCEDEFSNTSPRIRPDPVDSTTDDITFSNLPKLLIMKNR